MAETDGKNWAPRQKLIKHVLSSKVKSLNTCARTCPEAVLSTSFYGCQKTPHGVFDAMSWLVRPSLPWCFSVAGWCFQHKFLRISEDTFFGAISWFVRPSLPWCLSVAGMLASAAEVSMDFWKARSIFFVRFRGLSVLHRHGVSM